MKGLFVSCEISAHDAKNYDSLISLDNTEVTRYINLLI
jgi:hypothetical protein